MKLELGSGDRPFSEPGWLHSDARPLPHIQPGLVFDASVASHHVGCETCDELRATHLLEHFSHLRTVDILKDWLACLKPGGTLYVEVPNFERQAKLLLGIRPVGAAPPTLTEQREAVRLAYGGQDYEGNTHLTGFTPQTLQATLEEAGFVHVRVTYIDFVLGAHADRPRREPPVNTCEKEAPPMEAWPDGAPHPTEEVLAAKEAEKPAKRVKSKPPAKEQ